MSAQEQKSGSLFKRVMVALVFGPVIIWIFWSKGIALYAFATSIALIGQWELYRMLGGKLRGSHRIAGYLSGLLIIADAYFLSSVHLTLIIISALMIYFLIEIIDGKSDKFGHITVSLMATVYPALFLSFLVNIERIGTSVIGEQSGFILLYILLVIWMFDTASYFAGRFFGKRRFFPSVSPKKTVEGFIGGLTGVLCFGVIVALAADTSYMFHYITIAVITALSAQAGDLSESVIKRDLGIKDSSNIIPGHGGILDRFDSLIFASPAVYFYLLIYSNC
ncbi:phosphatidate cytidylyltransferase [Candidatus Latescibacterota bacterium]